MNAKQIEEVVFSYLKEQVGVQDYELNLEQPLDPLNLDSLDIIELGMHLEEHVGITFDNDWNLAEANTIGELIEIVCRKSGVNQ